MDKLLLACTLTLLLAACGGQGGTGAAAPVTTSPITIPGATAPVTAPVSTPTKRWSDPASWPAGKVPAEGEAVSLAAGTSLLLDVSPPRLGSLSVASGAALVFADTANIALNTDWIMLQGTLAIGSEAQPFTHRATITLTDQTPGEDVMGLGDRVLGVMGGRLELHGQQRLAWTHLARTARAGTTTLTLKAAPDWQPGDLLGLASTDFDPGQSEQITVRSVSGNTVTLSLPLKYTHWGDPETIDGQTVTEQAEVGLLSRNVVVQGGPDSAVSGFGGHLMVMKGSTVHIEGAELTRMGQRNALRRYPVHFHMMGSATGSYLRGSSLHDLFNRCVTVHGTNDLSIAQNVAYGTTGHCFFMEDGAETGNTLSGNLAMLVRAPDSKKGETPLLTSDKNPAAYWITNPSNTLTDNVAAGTDGSGFWYALPEHPTGPSAAVGGSVWPRHTVLGTFEGNLAHSGGTGLNVDDGNRADGTTTETTYYAPRQNPADEKSASVQAVFSGFVAYKNRERGVWLRGDHLLLRGGVLADNAVGATFAADHTGIEGTLLVGETANLGTPASWEPRGEGGRSLPRPWDASFPVRGFEFYDGTVTARNLSLARFFPTAQRGAVELHDSVECRVGRRKVISHYLLDRPPPVCQSQCHCWRPVQPFARHQVTLHQGRMTPREVVHHADPEEPRLHASLGPGMPGPPRQCRYPGAQRRVEPFHVRCVERTPGSLRLPDHLQRFEQVPTRQTAFHPSHTPLPEPFDDLCHMQLCPGQQAGPAPPAGHHLLPEDPPDLCCPGSQTVRRPEERGLEACHAPHLRHDAPDQRSVSRT